MNLSRRNHIREAAFVNYMVTELVGRAETVNLMQLLTRSPLMLLSLAS